MEDLHEGLAALEGRGNFNKTIDDVQAAIDALTKAKDRISNDPSTAASTLAGLKKPVKESFDKINGDLKEVHSVLNKYSKALDRKFKGPIFSAEDDAVSSHAFLINRAIAMHLLREGQFNVASTFIQEANAHPPSFSTSTLTPQQAWEFRSESLQKQFSEMYHILHELRHERNLAPAIQWARKHSSTLESRGSNLEFELCRLQFVRLFVGSKSHDPAENPADGPLRAWAYARSEFEPFQRRYEVEIRQLVGAMAFWENIVNSPYRNIFQNTSAWDEVASSFTKEFCSMLGLSADSPLYVAVTAGAIALPILHKAKTVMKANRTEWTTVQELPFEVTLPPAYHFHSIFVCPVSKEQATDANPPMMMPCGHVICKESLDKVSKGIRFKCPYCPNESNPNQARKVYL